MPRRIASRNRSGRVRPEARWRAGRGATGSGSEPESIRMDRVAVFVDAGYLFAQGSLELCGRKLERRHVSLDHRALIDALKEFAERTSGLPLLRIYWYDGTSQGPTSQHNTLADQADMKVRLGFVTAGAERRRFPGCDGHDHAGSQPGDGGVHSPLRGRRHQGRCSAGSGVRGTGPSTRDQARTGQSIPVSPPGG